jgi:di/tricarboxylate transporter
MTPEIIACLAILAIAIAAFAWDRLPADVIALGVMLAVIATGLLPADKAFAGFSSDTVMMILGLLIMTVGLVQTATSSSSPVATPRSSCRSSWSRWRCCLPS